MSAHAGTGPLSFGQFGPKLVGSGERLNALDGGQGWSVALSRDGRTALVGDLADNESRGAAWVFVRSGNVWVQQGPKLVGRHSITGGFGGWSVALSANGNTALIGAPGENEDNGAAWVFVRSGRKWTQQGPALVGAGLAPDTWEAFQGTGVALSADGNTALIGGPGDGGALGVGVNTGATWVFERSGHRWFQQGDKLVGSGGNPTGGLDGQGSSVALSGDGNTALIGSPNDGATGASWVFVRSGDTWTQQGQKLLASGAVPSRAQGQSVALSGDGTTALIGELGDDNGNGAAWVFTRSGADWLQEGPKLVGNGAVGFSSQGESVSLSGNGNTALVGGPNDRNSRGAAWLFTRRAGRWSQLGAKLAGTGGAHPDLANNPGQGLGVALSTDGNTALLGAPNDNRDRGAAWVFTRAGTGPAPKSFSVLRIMTFSDGPVSIRVAVPRPGRIDLLETAWNDNVAHAALLQPAARRFVYARKRSNVAGPRRVTITIAPNKRGRMLVAHHRYAVTLRLWVTYTPDHGQIRTHGYYGIHLPLSDQAEHGAG